MIKKKSISVSMEPELIKKAKHRASKLGLPFSVYLCQLVRADLQERKPLAVCEKVRVP